MICLYDDLGTGYLVTWFPHVEWTKGHEMVICLCDDVVNGCSVMFMVNHDFGNKCLNIHIYECDFTFVI